MQVRRDDGVDRAGLQHHARRHGVDEDALGLHLGILLLNLKKISSHKTMPWRCAFDLVTSEVLARALASQLEREAVHTLDAFTREDRGLGRDLLGQSLVHAASRAGVLAFGVLPDDDPVNIWNNAFTPGKTRAGRTLAYWSKPWQIGRRRPQSET